MVKPAFNLTFVFLVLLAFSNCTGSKPEPKTAGDYVNLKFPGLEIDVTRYKSYNEPVYNGDTATLISEAGFYIDPKLLRVKNISSFLDLLVSYSQTTVLLTEIEGELRQISPNSETALPYKEVADSSGFYPVIPIIGKPENYIKFILIRLQLINKKTGMQQVKYIKLINEIEC